MSDDGSERLRVTIPRPPVFWATLRLARGTRLQGHPTLVAMDAWGPGIRPLRAYELVEGLPAVPLPDPRIAPLTVCRSAPSDAPQLPMPAGLWATGWTDLRARLEAQDTPRHGRMGATAWLEVTPAEGYCVRAVTSDDVDEEDLRPWVPPYTYLHAGAQDGQLVGNAQAVLRSELRCTLADPPLRAPPP